MKWFTGTLYRSCNALVVVVLVLGLVPPGQDMSSTRFEPPIAHAQEGATTPLEKLMDEPDPLADGPSRGLLASKMAEPEVVRAVEQAMTMSPSNIILMEILPG